VRVSASLVRNVVQGAALVALVIGALAVRVVYSAQQELAEAHASVAGGDLDEAVVHYRRAARFYAPGSPYHVEALERLAVLGSAAEQRGDGERALAAYRAIRGSILASRSFYVPERARLSAADQSIARLMAELPLPGVDQGKSREQVRVEHLALLSADPDPSLLWTCVLLIGFVGWVGAAFVFCARAIDAEDRFVRREVRTWGGVIVVGFGLFVLGLALA
jgi:hypothetical protein